MFSIAMGNWLLWRERGKIHLTGHYVLPLLIGQCSLGECKHTWQTICSRTFATQCTRLHASLGQCKSAFRYIPLQCTGCTTLGEFNIGSPIACIDCRHGRFWVGQLLAVSRGSYFTTLTRDGAIKLSDRLYMHLFTVHCILHCTL